MTHKGFNKSSGRLLVITYHYVREQGGMYPGIHPVSVEELSNHIDQLKQKYHPASIEQVAKFSSGEKPLDRDSFLMPFDDGLQDHYKNVRNVLIQQNINGVFFIPTLPYSNGISPAVHKIHWLRANTDPDEFIVLLNRALPDKWSNLRISKEDQKRASKMHIHDDFKTQVLKFSLNFVIPYNIVNQAMSNIFILKGIKEDDFCRNTFMNAKQVRELAEDGNMIAMHGHSHVPFTSLNEQLLDRDIEKNSENIKSILGVRPNWLSYPYGRPDAIPDNVDKFCQRHKIDIAFSLISGINQFGNSSTSLKRITPNEINKYLGSR